MDPFAVDEEERESGGSPEGSSDNDQDGQMEDRDEEDIDGNEAADNDVEGEGENDEDDEDEEQDPDQEDSQYFFDGPHREQKTGEASQASLLSNTSGRPPPPQGSSLSAPTSHPNPSMLLNTTIPTQESLASNGFSVELPRIRPEVLTASVYDIVPTIAAPHSTSINSITATPDLRWVFSGGADGYIRKFNWLETANGKSMLTVAQRHPFVDSVTKAGVLMSYWENNEEFRGKSSDQEPHGVNTKALIGKASDDGSSISSVYSLAVQREGLWLLSGLESGGINLQSVRHDEGKRIAYLRGHTSAVSVLNLAQDEMSVLSGSWDKVVLDWDLNTGKTMRKFEGSGGQISALEIRPISTLPVPEASGDVERSDTLSSNTAGNTQINSNTINGADPEPEQDLYSENVVNGDVASPTDSLFGGNDVDSLFGDNDNDVPGAPSGGAFVDDDDDEFSRAIANGRREQEEGQEQATFNEDAEGDVQMTDASQSANAASRNEEARNGNLEAAEERKSNQEASSSSATLTNGLPHSDELRQDSDLGESSIPAPEEPPPTSESTFLAASIDGSLRVWDKPGNRGWEGSSTEVLLGYEIGVPK
ncbi:transcriptional activator SPT8, partial [Lecanoromycetidae sp. Uapishka_2]